MICIINSGKTGNYYNEVISNCIFVIVDIINK